MIIAVIGKGGAGKTTITSLLLRRLLDAGQKPVLAIDADPSSCLGPVLGVKAESRRRGVASSLMSKLFEASSAEGIDEVLVGTTVDNAAARRTYEKAGMKLVGHRTGTRLAVHGARGSA